ncbi:PREDICTED: solute carrier family 23 member 2-like, partial [Priapulus caudatus]|uniref:Solute carrier family 23 member 2-like n=1 Tax=Priapulus caudatus TaxID=37621 RepID=A0ABM1F7M7_PRICU
MFGSTMIVPLLVTPQMCIPPTSTAKGEIIATLFFVSGIVTLLQTTFGIRLPIVQGATFSFLAPTFAILALPKWKCPSETEIEALMNETNGTFDIGEIWKPRMREVCES